MCRPTQAEKVYLSLRPLASATAIDAALTGVLLWLAGLIGGWCENFAVYHRIPASIAQHPLGQTIGAGRMQKTCRLGRPQHRPLEHQHLARLSDGIYAGVF